MSGAGYIRKRGKEGGRGLLLYYYFLFRNYAKTERKERKRKRE